MPGVIKLLKNLFTKGSKAAKNTGPVSGSLDESFQKFVKKKNLLNQKGFFGPGGYRGKFQQNIDKFKVNKPKIKENEQLKLNLKTGGSIGAIGPNGVL